MSQLLLHYQKVDPTTWAYLSSLLMIGLYFKFSRFWSVRNVDLLLLVLLAPGLLLAYYGGESEVLFWRKLKTAQQELEFLLREPPTPVGVLPEVPRTTKPSPVAILQPGAERPESAESLAMTPDSEEPGTAEGPETGEEPALPMPTAEDVAVAGRTLKRAQDDWDSNRFRMTVGYIWLLVIAGLFLVRLLLDCTWSRRPLLEPNLSTGGLIFLGCSLFAFLMANVITSVPTDDDIRGARGAAQLLHREAMQEGDNDLVRHGPGYAVLNLLPSVPTMSILGRDGTTRSALDIYSIVAKAMAISAHLAVVIGIIAVGYQHFDNLRMGIGAATLYLMLPYTAIMTGRVDHVLPAALLVWAIALYRRPLLAGIFIGLSAGVVYYPLFLLPLWISFYWQRGVWRFVGGIVGTLAIMVLSLALVSSNSYEFWGNVQKMFGLWLPVREGLQGIWRLGWDANYRLPVLAAFFVMSCSLAIWPAQKNLGTLLSCSAAVMVATQFWHGYGGGLYMAWYLPLALLTIFRPNLEDRVALTVLGEGWFVRRVRAA